MNIKPCPFCETSNHVYCQTLFDSVAYVICHRCWAAGPQKSTPEAAVEAWNRVAGMREQITEMKKECNRLAKFIGVNGKNREDRQEAVLDLLQLGKGDKMFYHVCNDCSHKWWSLYEESYCPKCWGGSIEVCER